MPKIFAEQLNKDYPIVIVFLLSHFHVKIDRHADTMKTFMVDRRGPSAFSV